MTLRKPPYFFAAVFAGFALDLWSKHAVFERIPLGESVPVWEGVLHLKSAYNPGGAFSMFGDHPWLLVVLCAVIASGLVWWYLKMWKTEAATALWGYGLVLSGAFGNLIDRIREPHMVRDFFDFRPQLPIVGHWAIFNVADIFICVGVGLFLLAAIRGPKEVATPDPKQAHSA